MASRICREIVPGLPIPKVDALKSDSPTRERDSASISILPLLPVAGVTSVGLDKTLLKISLSPAHPSSL
jgi:hypothetical protein